MFVGEHLGKYIPSAISSYFVDAEAGITVKTNLNSKAFRVRFGEPETIKVLTNCDAVATINIYQGQSKISVTTDVTTLAKRLRKNQSAIAIESDIDIDYNRIRKNKSAIEVISNAIADGNLYVFGASDIDAQTDLDALAKRWRNNEPNIDVTTDVDALVKRLRNDQSAINADAEVDTDYTRIRKDQSAIEVIVDLSASAERTIFGAAAMDAQVELDTVAVRWRNSEANIDAETVVDVIGGILAQLFDYTGDIAPGDVVVIDTDNLTVEDSTGSNLREYFDGEWWKVDPNSKESVTWQDGETDRDVELVVEKEDRSV